MDKEAQQVIAIGIAFLLIALGVGSCNYLNGETKWNTISTNVVSK